MGNETDYRLNLGKIEAFKPLHNVIDAGARLKIFKDP
jgi:hypothetical protein